MIFSSQNLSWEYTEHCNTAHILNHSLTSIVSLESPRLLPWVICRVWGKGRHSQLHFLDLLLLLLLVLCYLFVALDSKQSKQHSRDAGLDGMVIEGVRWIRFFFPFSSLTFQTGTTSELVKKKKKKKEALKHFHPLIRLPTCLLFSLDNVIYYLSLMWFITFHHEPGWTLLSWVQPHFVAEAAEILFLNDKPMDQTVYLKPELTSSS